MGWWSGLNDRQWQQALRYLRTDGEQIHWDFIATALASVADLALFPLQDLLGLGADARMNTPGSAEGNWQWRFRLDQIDGDMAGRLAESSRLYGRRPYA